MNVCRLEEEGVEREVEPGEGKGHLYGDRDGEDRAEKEHDPLLRVGGRRGREAGKQHCHQVAGGVAEEGLLEAGGLDAGVSENPQVPLPPPTCLGSGHLCTTNMQPDEGLYFVSPERKREGRRWRRPPSEGRCSEGDNCNAQPRTCQQNFKKLFKIVLPFQGNLMPWATWGVCRASVGTLPPVSRYWIRLKSNVYFNCSFVGNIKYVDN